MRHSLTLIFVLLAAPAGLAETSLPLPTPLSDADFPSFSQAEIALGRDLFWDKILSGNQNISCASCHHPRFGTSDGLSLGMGEGGIGLGPARKPDPNDYPELRVARNAPALWNVGAHGFTVMFADGRIEVDPKRQTGFRTPLDDEMIKGFVSVLSAQTMFPVLANDEMAGHYEESDVSALVRQGRLTGSDGAWSVIAARVAAVPAYSAAFKMVYPEIAAGRPIAFTDLSNAIAAYMTFDFRSDTSPFDDWLRGNGTLDAATLRGKDLFYGNAGCATCHSGPLFSDMKFHAMGDPQIGPGKTERFESSQHDIGRQRVSNNPADAFAFRTPSLRNVTLTGPYGHAGAYASLDAYLRQHTNPGSGLVGYSLNSAVLPAMETGKPDLDPSPEGADFDGIALAAKSSPRVSLSDSEIEDIEAFLKSLEDPVAIAGGRLTIPENVPSGLSIDR